MRCHGGRRQQARRAVAGMGLQDLLKGCRRGVHEIGTGAAVHVQVDIARGHVSVLSVDLPGIGRLCRHLAELPHCLDAPLAHEHCAAGEHAVGQDHIAAKQHTTAGVGHQFLSWTLNDSSAG